MQNTFGKEIIPDGDAQRVEALKSYKILDTEPEVFFNNLAHLAAQCFHTPIALISLVDAEQVYFKANVGMAGTHHVDRGVSLCSLAVLESHPTVFEDTLDEPCLLTNPLVAGEFGLRFYAGAPIITPDGFHIGTVCVVDKKPRPFSELDQDLLTRFAGSVMEALLDRKAVLDKNGE